MKTTLSLSLVLSLVTAAAACANAPPGDSAAGAQPASASTNVALEQALADVDTGRDPAGTRARLEAILADPATSRVDRGRGDLALAKLLETTDQARAVTALEDAVAAGNEDADKRLFTLLAGHAPPSPWRLRDDTPVAPSAFAFAKYYPAATPDTKVEIEMASFGPRQTRAQEALGTFSIGSALRQNAIDACGLCDEVKTTIHTHSSRENLWSSIPAEASRLDKALVVLYVDQETLVPERYAKWLALPAAEVRAALARGEGIYAVKERAGAPPLVTIAAPRVSQLMTVEASLAAQKDLPAEPVTVKLASGLTKEEIRSGVRARFGAFKACYEALLERRPKAAGTANLAFTVTNTGAITNATVSLDSALDEPAHRACFEQAVAAIRYPAWSKDAGEKTTVRYPIRLAP